MNGFAKAQREARKPLDLHAHREIIRCGSECISLCGWWDSNPQVLRETAVLKTAVFTGFTTAA